MRMTSSSRMGLPSSVTATAPARCERAEVGKRASAAAARGGGDGKNVDDRFALGMAQPRDPFRSIDNRRCVGHAADGREASRSSGGGSAGDGFFVVLPGLAQVDVQVDEAGSDDQAARIEFLIAGNADFVRLRNLGDAAIAQENIHRPADLCQGIDQVAALNQERRRFGFVVWHEFDGFGAHRSTPSLYPTAGLFLSFTSSRHFRAGLSGAAARRLDPRKIRHRAGCKDPSGSGENPWLISPFPMPAPELPCAWGRRCGLRRRSRIAARRRLQRLTRGRG